MFISLITNIQVLEFEESALNNRLLKFIKRVSEFPMPYDRKHYQGLSLVTVKSIDL